MAKYVQIRTLEHSDFAPLLHAPNVLEAKYISEQITNAKEEDWLYIVASYRGHELYLNDGSLIVRTNPPFGGNGYVAGPLPDSEEECFVRLKDETWHKALVYFFS